MAIKQTYLSNSFRANSFASLSWRGYDAVMEMPPTADTSEIDLEIADGSGFGLEAATGVSEHELTIDGP